MSSWTALLLAGSRPGGDPFAQRYGTDLKALIPVGGRADGAAAGRGAAGERAVEPFDVLAQQPERIARGPAGRSALSVEPSGETIAATLEAFCFDPDTRWPILVTTADHALLTPEMVGEFCARPKAPTSRSALSTRHAAETLAADEADLATFRGGAYSGANLFAARLARRRPAIELWRANEQNRKKAWRMLLTLGLAGSPRRGAAAADPPADARRASAASWASTMRAVRNRRSAGRRSTSTSRRIMSWSTAILEGRA